MAYFKDLSVYVYGGNERPWPLENNVGWLGPGKPFATAKPSEALLDLIWKFCKVRVNPTRGIHSCHLCPQGEVHIPPFESHFYARNGERLLLGSAEIRSFSNRGPIFAAPNLVYHYVEAHHYCPPSEFVDSLSESPCPPEPEYLSRLAKLGHDWNPIS
jgi:hypothetical protein